MVGRGGFNRKYKFPFSDTLQANEARKTSAVQQVRCTDLLQYNTRLWELHCRCRNYSLGVTCHELIHCNSPSPLPEKRESIYMHPTKCLRSSLKEFNRNIYLRILHFQLWANWLLVILQKPQLQLNILMTFQNWWFDLRRKDN